MMPKMSVGKTDPYRPRFCVAIRFKNLAGALIFSFYSPGGQLILTLFSKSSQDLSSNVKGGKNKYGKTRTDDKNTFSTNSKTAALTSVFASLGSGGVARQLL